MSEYTRLDREFGAQRELFDAELFDALNAAKTKAELDVLRLACVRKGAPGILLLQARMRSVKGGRR